ncbi:hypothetical protein F2P56_033973 [Juglans regia]|uniref:PGG domain-containing protein n=1 Tax=Juglans regia TaxID=51240 RepID=A0A833WVN9_JUGRE|nr:hypothetical protein F2P56_033973 [Juglans regia]
MSTQLNQPAVSSLQKSRTNRVLDFLFKRGDTASEVRNALLVVMALIAAATFQVGLHPPGGVWQDTTKDHGVNHEAGTAILGSYPHNCRVFYFFNTIAFATSIYVILFLLFPFPFFPEVLIGLVSFSVAYGISTTSNLHGAACLNRELVILTILIPLAAMSYRSYVLHFKTVDLGRPGPEVRFK